MIKCQRFYFVTESCSSKITENKTKNNLLKEFSSYLDILMQKQIIFLCFHDGVTTVTIRVMTKAHVFYEPYIYTTFVIKYCGLDSINAEQVRSVGAPVDILFRKDPLTS